jgi:hypothetical protein
MGCERCNEAFSASAKARLLVITLQGIAHQGDGRDVGRERRSAPSRETNRLLADDGHHLARAGVARVWRVARIGLDDNDLNDVSGVRRA